MFCSDGAVDALGCSTELHATVSADFTKTAQDTCLGQKGQQICVKDTLSPYFTRVVIFGTIYNRNISRGERWTGKREMGTGDDVRGG
jgi:hypothetical protein